MNVLLSGATGFIGSKLISLNDKLHIKTVVRNTESISDIDDCFHINSINENTNWEGAFNNIDVVIHLAGIAHNKSSSLNEIFDVNTLGTLNFARNAAAFGVKRFVFISSSLVNHQHSDSMSAQTLSKYKAEIGLKEIARETGLEVVIVRPTLVYGDNAPGNFGLLLQLISKLPFLPFGLVNNRRDFISVQNLVDLLIVCASHPSAGGHTFLASDGAAVSIKDFTTAIAKGINKSIYQLPIPTKFMRFVASLAGRNTLAEQLLDDFEVDSSNTLDVMGWVPPYSMEQAMTLLSKEMK